MQKSTAAVQGLAKLALRNADAAIYQMMSENCVEQDLRALRAYPEALTALWRADKASKKLKQMLEDTMESVGMQMVS